MIKLDVKDYCQNCTKFDPVVDREIRTISDPFDCFPTYETICDTAISCSRKQECHRMYNYILENTKRRKD